MMPEKHSLPLDVPSDRDSSISSTIATTVQEENKAESSSPLQRPHHQRRVRINEDRNQTVLIRGHKGDYLTSECFGKLKAYTVRLAKDFAAQRSADTTRPSTRRDILLDRFDKLARSSPDDARAWLDQYEQQQQHTTTTNTSIFLDGPDATDTWFGVHKIALRSIAKDKARRREHCLDVIYQHQDDIVLDRTTKQGLICAKCTEITRPSRDYARYLGIIAAQLARE